MKNNISSSFSSELKSCLTDLNNKSQKYIEDVIKILDQKIGSENLISLTLFGSQIPNNCDNNNISDCDLLIILSNSLSKKLIKKCEEEIISLEIQHKFRERNGALPKKALKAIEQSTGMFMSHFITKEKHLKNKKFHRIFRVNRIFSLLFAPRKIVLNNVIESNKNLYGIPINQILETTEVPPWEILKSLVMNLMISFFSLLISPFREFKAIKYQLEAVKWSLRAANYYAFEEYSTLSAIVKRFNSKAEYSQIKDWKRYFNKFFLLRDELRNDIWFMLRSPINILKIHRKGILFRKHLYDH